LCHLAYEFSKADLWLPTELTFRLRRVAEQRVDFRRTEVTWIDRDNDAPFAIHALLVQAGATPSQFNTQLTSDRADEFPNAMLVTRCDDIVARAVLLKDQPLRSDVVARVAPVALRVEVAQVQAGLQAHPDAGQTAGDFPGDEILTTHR